MNQVQVSFPALAQYAALARRQQGHVHQIRGLVDGSCARFGAFTGFLWFFGSAYRDAHDAVGEGLAQAARGAGDLGAGFDGVLADFRATDQSTEQEFCRLLARADDAAPYGGPGPHPGGPGVPAALKTTAAGVGTAGLATTLAARLPRHLADGLPARTPPLPDARLRGLPTDAIDLATGLSDTLAAGGSIGQARDDAARYEEFEERQGARR